MQNTHKKTKQSNGRKNPNGIIAYHFRDFYSKIDISGLNTIFLLVFFLHRFEKTNYILCAAEITF